jgi:uncharacterized protein with von Willebrand factor type A (vWA) domain
MMDPFAGVVAFVNDLRAAGVGVDITRIALAAEALAALHSTGRDGVYWAMRLTLCSRQADLDPFDNVFAAWFDGRAATFDHIDDATVVQLSMVGSDVFDTSAAACGVAGDAELLTVRDVRTLTVGELAEINVLIGLLTPVARARPAMRRRPGGSTRIDMSRTVRLMIRNGGEPARLLYRRRADRPRRLLLLIDISGSMRTYSDALLRFAHAAVAAGPTTTEVITLGTRWTRVTAELRGRRPDAALRAVGQVKSDWDGGTRLGPTLQSFLREWGGRNAVRSAVVAIGSDGIEFGDPALLARQVARLSRIGRRLIWVNPKQGLPGYRPTAPGLVDSLPFADERLPGHSFDALRKLAEVIAQ